MMFVVTSNVQMYPDKNTPNPSFMQYVNCWLISSVLMCGFVAFCPVWTEYLWRPNAMWNINTLNQVNLVYSPKQRANCAQSKAVVIFFLSDSNSVDLNLQVMNTRES